MERLRDSGDQDGPPHAHGALRALRRLGPWQNPPGYKERVRRAIDAARHTVAGVVSGRSGCPW